MTYSRHLREIILQNPLDYSALQVFVKWVIQISSVSSPTLGSIHPCAQLLEGIVSPTSGLLLIELWTSLASMEPSATDKQQVDRLSLAESRLLSSSNVPPNPSHPRSMVSSVSSPRILEVMSLWTLPHTRSAVDDENLMRLTESISQVCSILVQRRRKAHILHQKVLGDDHHSYYSGVRRLDNVSLSLELALLSQSDAVAVYEVQLRAIVG